MYILYVLYHVPGFVSQAGGASPPPATQTTVLRRVAGGGSPYPPFLRPPALSHSRNVCRVTQQTCLLSNTADMSSGSCGRHVLLCHTVAMSAMSHSGHVSCVTQQTCMLWHTADVSAVWHNRHVCCVLQHT